MITKIATDKNNLTENLIFTNSARKAFEYILKVIKINAGNINILLPAYIGITDREGSGVFDPVEANNAAFSFYPLNRDLSVDVDSLKKKITHGDFNVMLIIHYFGICKSDLSGIKQLCVENNIFLIEDCAHAFQLGLEKQNLGVIGDFSFYSIHKYLPTESGGILKINSNKLDVPVINEVDKIDPEIMIQLTISKYYLIAEKRRNNFIRYGEILKDQKGIKVMFDIESHEVPQTFPILIENNLREKLYFYLIESGTPVVALYYRMIDQILKKEFPITYNISESILNLPVHQDILNTDIENICKSIKLFFKNNG